MSLEITVSGEKLRIEFKGSLVLEHHPDRPAVSAGRGKGRYRESHGNWRIRDGHRQLRNARGFTILEATGEHGTVLFPGVARLDALLDESRRLRIRVTGEEDNDNRLSVSFAAEPGERCFGGGEQFSRTNLRGRRFPLWSEEQGVGRGELPITLFSDLRSGGGGRWWSTYWPQPTLVTDRHRVIHSDATAYGVLDLRSNNRLIFSAWQREATFVYDIGSDARHAVGAVSALLGRQPRLPSWTQNGMILGVQGGTEKVQEKYRTARDAGVAVAGLWAQDWEGRRVTSFGKQLMWNWAYEPSLYPNLPETIASYRDKGIRFLGYINPMLALEKELYAEAREKGYLVVGADGEPRHVVSTTFPAGLVDFTNADAFAWYKGIIKENMIGIGLSGWMADFAEYLPVDAALASGGNPEILHNVWPVLWARCNREAVDESGLTDEILFFHRSGGAGTSAYATAAWAGDQLVNWGRHDGLATVIPAALSAGYSGIANHHSDIGGYTTLGGIRRTGELFRRWAEQAALSPLMRSHEGNRPEDNHQFWSSRESLEHLGRMTRLFAGLSPYRESLTTEYQNAGLPMIRPIRLHYGDDPRWSDESYRYLLGPDLYVAPVLRPGQRRQSATLPGDDWVHLWSGREYGGGRITVDARVGEPPVFFRRSSSFAPLFRDLPARAAAGMTR